MALVFWKRERERERERKRERDKEKEKEKEKAKKGGREWMDYGCLMVLRA